MSIRISPFFELTFIQNLKLSALLSEKALFSVTTLAKRDHPAATYSDLYCLNPLELILTPPGWNVSQIPSFLHIQSGSSDSSPTAIYQFMHPDGKDKVTL